MDDIYLAHYLREINLQATAMRVAVSEINVARHASDAFGTIAAAQAIINPAMAVTRLLWPNPASRAKDGTPLEGEPEERRQWTLKRGKQLRKIVGPIDEQSSPLGSRKVRNSFEHFDEYLDGFLFEVNQGKRPHHIFDIGVFSKGDIAYSDSEVEPVSLRHFDPSTNSVGVLAESLEIQPLVNEVERVEKKALEWLAKHNAGGS